MSGGPPVHFGNTGANLAQSNTVVSTITTQLNQAQQELVNDNLRKLYRPNTVKDHNNRIKKFIRILHKTIKKNPNFIKNGGVKDVIRKINIANVPDKSWYVYSTRNGRNFHRKYDLIWANITPDMMNLFYTDEKYNCKYEHGFLKLNSRGVKMMLGFDARRKYFDALTFGSKIANEELSRDLLMAKPIILKSLKVANAEHQGSGQVEESDADPIPRPLCELICKYAVGIGLGFWWLFTLLQWNCMARSQNIDNLRFTNFKVSNCVLNQI
jgi:hypothetical protein